MPHMADAERTPVWLMRQAGRYMAEFREYSDKYPFRMRSETPDIAIELSLQVTAARWPHDIHKLCQQQQWRRRRQPSLSPSKLITSFKIRAMKRSTANIELQQQLLQASSRAVVALPLSLRAKPRPCLCVFLQPWRAFKPDGVIFFSDILTPLPALGIEFDVIKGKGPRIDTPIRSMDQVSSISSGCGHGRRGAGRVDSSMYSLPALSVRGLFCSSIVAVTVSLPCNVETHSSRTVCFLAYTRVVTPPTLWRPLLLLLLMAFSATAGEGSEDPR